MQVSTAGIDGGSPGKQGLQLDRVVLLGRTFDEYRRYFAFDEAWLRGKAVLDVASGVSSFCAESTAKGLDVTAFDLIYDLPAATIRPKCETDLDHVVTGVRGLTTYKWEFYRDPEYLRGFRERAYQTFLPHYEKEGARRYVAGRLPSLPFADNQFDATLVSYLLFVYQDHLDYEFHRDSILDIMRVTRGEARIYPLVTFEAKRSEYLDRMFQDPACAHLRFEQIATDFEFLAGSNSYLRITSASQ
jgi:hypothetical protein